MFFIAIIEIKNEVIFVAGRETPPSETHHEEVPPMRQYLQTIGCTRSANDTLPEIPFMMIKDSTMGRTTTITIPRPHNMVVVDFISLFDVDIFCLVGKRSEHQSLNS